MLTRVVEEIIKDEHVRNTLEGALRRNVGNALVLTGSSGLGKSTTIACGIAAMSYRAPGQVTLCLQHELRDADRHTSYTRSTAFAGGCLSRGGIGWPDGVEKSIIEYSTYDALVRMLMDPQTKEKVANFNCLIFDEVHRQSIDQEIVMAAVGTNVPVVMMTAYDDSGFLTDCRLPIGETLDLNTVHKGFEQPSTNLIRHTPEQGVAYESWALQMVEYLLGEDPEAAILVFLEDTEALDLFKRTLTRTLKNQPMTCLVKGSKTDMDTFRSCKGARVVLGVANFGSRCFIEGVTSVICDGYRCLHKFDQVIAKDIPAKYRLKQSEFLFLYFHATAPNSNVYTYMSEETIRGLEAGVSPDWLYGRACEYYLKTICVFPERVTQPFRADRFPLRYFHSHELVQWVVKQLLLLDLICESGEYKKVTATWKGRFVVSLMTKTEVPFASAVYLAWFRGNKMTQNPTAAFFYVQPIMPFHFRSKSGKLGGEEEEELLRAFGQFTLPAPFDAFPVVLTGDILAISLVNLNTNVDPKIRPMIPRWEWIHSNSLAYELNAADMTFNFKIPQVPTPFEATQLQRSMLEQYEENPLHPIWSALLATFTFNLAYIEHASHKPWVAKDFCSGRDVYIDEGSLIDAPTLVEGAKELGSNGVFVIYRFVRKLADSRYVISDLSYIPQDMVAKLLVGKGFLHAESMIGSPFK